MTEQEFEQAYAEKWGIVHINQYVREQFANGVHMETAIREYQTMANAHFKKLGILA